MNDLHETPDIEVMGDQYEQQQKALKEMADADAREYEAFYHPDEEVGEFRFKGGDRVVQKSTDRAGRVMNACKGECVTYGVVLDDVGYTVILDSDLTKEIA